MALILCPECSKEISDKAQSCPSCGYPLTKGSTDAEENISTKKDEFLPVDVETEKETPEADPPNGRLATWIAIGIIITIVAIPILKNAKEQRELEKIRKETASQPKSTTSYSSTTSTDLPTSKEKRETFASSIKQALNAPGLPTMCERAYFNDLGELIIEVNGEWIILDDGLKEDMVYVIKELLKDKKSDLGVEGYGQFFSTSGQGLESFYAK